MLHAVIMAGGAGSRFWPESREARPKQLLPLLGQKSMIRATLDRLGALVPRERMLVVTTRMLAQAIADELPDLPRAGVLAEPCRRDTAGCIGLAAVEILARDPDALLIVLPADHAIGPTAVFVQALGQAVRLVEADPRRIATFGIRPNYPAESFGYIERGAPLPEAEPGTAAFTVQRFHEKPRIDVAREYLDSGRFYWNSGIFVFRAATILDELAAQRPALHRGLQAIAAHIGAADYPAVLEREFAALERISIDRAVMEHARQVVVIEASFDWDDLGSWQALARLAGHDEHGNTVVGRHVGVRTEGTIVHGAPDHLIATVGLRDCLIVHTPDATLVANKHDEEAIRQVVELLREKGWLDYL
ncbi:MAG TPA: mannose-1-phosphate guanylyltransferase [Pirellulales bacterium]